MIAADPLAPFIRHVVAPLWARRERSPYLSHYGRLRCLQYDSPDEIRDRQLRALTEMVRHAYQTTPFWRQRLRQAGVSPNDVRSFEGFRAVPPLTKDDLRTAGAALFSDRFERTALSRKRTSGSTGLAVEVWVDEDARQWKRACTLLCDEWSSWRLGQRVAKLWGNPPHLQRGWRGRVRNALLDRARHLDTLKMDEAVMAEFAASLRRRPPALLFGHAHSLYLFAEFVRHNGGAGFRPRGIISTAMALHDHERRGITAAFGRPVTNRYGCEEVSLIASECEHHCGLHVNAEGVYVEVLRPDGRNAAAGEAGAVVVTDLVNRAMPILRYQVGDVAVRGDRRCPCGRGWPLLDRLEGREADYVVTPDGRLVSGISLTENFAVLVPGVAQLQVVQESLHHLRFRIARGPEFGRDSLDCLRRLVGERFGPSVSYECEYLDQIPPEPSGKYRFCISKVTKSFARPAEVAV